MDREITIDLDYVIKLNAVLETDFTDEQIEHAKATAGDALREMIISEITGGIGTVDVEPVVRCKDCKRYSGKYCTLTDDTEDRREPNDYCSYGERKEVQE